MSQIEQGLQQGNPAVGQESPTDSDTETGASHLNAKPEPATSSGDVGLKNLPAVERPRSPAATGQPGADSQHRPDPFSKERIDLPTVMPAVRQQPERKKSAGDAASSEQLMHEGQEIRPGAARGAGAPNTGQKDRPHASVARPPAQEQVRAADQSNTSAEPGKPAGPAADHVRVSEPAHTTRVPTPKDVFPSGRARQDTGTSVVDTTDAPAHADPGTRAEEISDAPPAQADHAERTDRSFTTPGERRPPAADVEYKDDSLRDQPLAEATADTADAGDRAAMIPLGEVVTGDSVERQEDKSKRPRTSPKAVRKRVQDAHDNGNTRQRSGALLDVLRLTERERIYAGIEIVVSKPPAQEDPDLQTDSRMIYAMWKLRTRDGGKVQNHFIAQQSNDLANVANQHVVDTLILTVDDIRPQTVWERQKKLFFNIQRLDDLLSDNSTRGKSDLRRIRDKKILAFLQDSEEIRGSIDRDLNLFTTSTNEDGLKLTMWQPSENNLPDRLLNSNVFPRLNVNPKSYDTWLDEDALLWAKTQCLEDARSGRAIVLNEIANILRIEPTEEEAKSTEPPAEEKPRRVRKRTRNF